MFFIKKNKASEPHTEANDGVNDENLMDQGETEEISSSLPNSECESVDSKAPNDQPKDFSKYVNVDWKRVSSEKVFSVMAEVMLENQRLNVELERLNVEIEQNYKVNNSNKDKSREYLEEIAHKIAPNVISEINAGAKLRPIEIKERIINEVLLSKRKYLKKILELNETIKSNKELLTELQQQCYDLVNKVNSDGPEEEQKSFTKEEFKQLTIDNVDENEPKEQKCVLKFVPLDEARELFLQSDVLNLAIILGSAGISEFPKIVTEAQKYGISENRVETLMAKMEKNEIVSITKIYTFQRNTGLRLVRLTDVGINFYKEHYKKVPVKPEMQVIKEENDNYEHGYSIKDVLSCLAEMGYEDYSMSRNQNTIKFENGYAWIPDVIAFNPITKKKEYFEVEMGTHNQENFFRKLDKALLVCSELKIIVKNKIVADKVLGKCNAWYNQKKSKPNIVIRILTYQEFKQKMESTRFVPKVIEEKTGLLEETINKKEEPIKNAPTKNTSTKNTFKNDKKKHTSESIGEEEII